MLVELIIDTKCKWQNATPMNPWNWFTCVSKLVAIECNDIALEVVKWNNYLTCLINRTCEICGSIAHNVPGAIEVQLTEQWNEASDPSIVPPTAPATAEPRNFWQGHRFLNFLLACMIFAFVISWLFHFNVPSWISVLDETETGEMIKGLLIQ